jgi:hypothetical protein
MSIRNLARFAVAAVLLMSVAGVSRGARPAAGELERVASPLRAVRTDAAVAAASATTGQEWLSVSSEALASLEARKGRFRMEAFPIGPGVRADLLLERFQVVMAGAQVLTMTAQGERREPLKPVTQFKGTVDGHPDSRVYVGVWAGVLVAYVQSDLGLTYIGPEDSKGSGGSYIVRAPSSSAYDEIAFAAKACRADELPPLVAETVGALESSVAGPDGAIYKQAGVSVETDQELRNFFPSAAAMMFYIQNIFGAGSVIYERDVTMRLLINLIQVWEIPDPYGSETATLAQLYALGNWWHSNRPLASYPRATVHFLSKVANNGGVAWRPALCIADLEISPGIWAGGYGVSQVLADYPTTPWDIFVTTHEIGHNSGTLHTHCYTPPIDMCYSGEVIPPSTPCYAGPMSVPMGGGTIMSYCHLRPGGLANVNLVFHPRCIGEQMLPYINSRACLGIVDDQPLAFGSITPNHGTILGGTPVAVAGNGFDPGVNVELGGVDVLVTAHNQTSVIGFTQAHPLGSVPLVLRNLDTTTVTIPNGFIYHFGDVPPSHGFFSFINRIANFGVTSGCGGGNYCPDSVVTRDQMAVFLLVSKEGSAYSPPVCTVASFADVPCSNPFSKWIYELANPARQITAGCGGGNYCPTAPVTRETMAAFLLRTHGGPSYTPPDCVTPPFTDMPCTNPFAKWVKELVFRGITAGCGGGNYCPALAVTRGQMAVFLAVTFNLPV